MGIGCLRPDQFLDHLTVKIMLEMTILKSTAGNAQDLKSRLEFPVDNDRVDSTMIVPRKPFQESL